MNDVHHPSKGQILLSLQDHRLRSEGVSCSCIQGTFWAIPWHRSSDPSPRHQIQNGRNSRKYKSNQNFFSEMPEMSIMSSAIFWGIQNHNSHAQTNSQTCSMRYLTESIRQKFAHKLRRETFIDVFSQKWRTFPSQNLTGILCPKYRFD